MKKFINELDNIEAELVRGLVRSKASFLRQLPDSNVVVRTHKKRERVAVMFGCGSGHEPAPCGYVGHGILDAAVPGGIFSAPTPDQILKGIREIASESGVLCILLNYTGDVLSFRMAIQMAQMEGIAVDNVVVADDVSSDARKATGRRGLAGAVLINKIAGAEAEMGVGLYEVKEAAEWATAGLRTIGVASSPCIVPAEGKPSFELGEEEMEVGMGIHGEPGVVRVPMLCAADTAREMLDRLLADYNYKGCEVVVLINGLGGTSVMELYIVNDFVGKYLAEHDVEVYDTMIGNFMSSMEMKGFSISLMRVDPHLKALYDAPARTAALCR